MASVHAIIKNYGWGNFSGCHTKLDVEGTAAEKLQASKDLFDTLHILRQGVVAAGDAVLRGLPALGLARPWTTAYENGYFAHREKRVFSECGIARSLAYRVKGTWSVALDFTNAPGEVRLLDWQRAYYTEVLHVADGGAVQSVGVDVPECEAGNATVGSKGKAVVQLWGGAPKWSSFLTSELEENPALKVVLRELNDNEYVTSQVDEAFRLSNTAILLLPSVFVLVPIHLFQFVDEWATGLYIILTNLCSVTPIAIKGIELLIFYYKKHYSTISYVYGQSSSEVMAAETWVSACQLRTSVKWHGIGYLLFAICTFVAGLVLEMVVRYALVPDMEAWNLSVNSYFAKLKRTRDAGEPSEEFIKLFFKENCPGGYFWHRNHAHTVRKKERNFDKFRHRTCKQFLSDVIVDLLFAKDDFILKEMFDNSSRSVNKK